MAEEINKSMSDLADRYSYEIILVNDFPADDTFEVIKKLAKEDEHIIGVNLARNFGQHAALMAGFHYCSGDITVCLDDDGQTPADEVGKLLDKLEEGYDVVYAKYTHKQHSAFRNFGSRVNELMTRFMLGKPKELYISSYFAARKFVVEEMKKYRNSYPYVIGLVLRTTKNITNVEVCHREREIGTSGYTLVRRNHTNRILPHRIFLTVKVCHCLRRVLRFCGISVWYLYDHQKTDQPDGADGLEFYHGGDHVYRRNDDADVRADWGIYRPHLHQPE